MSARYVTSGVIEANYLTRDQNQKPNETGTSIEGIDVTAENAFSGISKYVKEGSYLTPSDYDMVLLGPQLVDRYSKFV